MRKKWTKSELVSTCSGSSSILHYSNEMTHFAVTKSRLSWPCYKHSEYIRALAGTGRLELRHTNKTREYNEMSENTSPALVFMGARSPQQDLIVSQPSLVITMLRRAMVRPLLLEHLHCMLQTVIPKSQKLSSYVHCHCHPSDCIHCTMYSMYNRYY